MWFEFFPLSPFFAKEQLTQWYSSILRTKMREFCFETVSFNIMSMFLQGCGHKELLSSDTHYNSVVAIPKQGMGFICICQWCSGSCKAQYDCRLYHKLTNRRQDVICYDLVLLDFFIRVIIYFPIYFFLLEGFGQWVGVVLPTARVNHPLMVSYNPIIRHGIP